MRVEAPVLQSQRRLSKARRDFFERPIAKARVAVAGDLGEENAITIIDDFGRARRDKFSANKGLARQPDAAGQRAAKRERGGEGEPVVSFGDLDPQPGAGPGNALFIHGLDDAGGLRKRAHGLRFRSKHEAVDALWQRVVSIETRGRRRRRSSSARASAQPRVAPRAGRWRCWGSGVRSRPAAAARSRRDCDHAGSPVPPAPRSRRPA